MVQFLRRSPVFRQLMGDLFSGTQDYTSLKRRLWGHLGITVSEFISSVFEPRSTRQGHRATRGNRGRLKITAPFRSVFRNIVIRTLLASNL